MPTPFQHLAYTVDILEAPELPGAVRARLKAEEGAFLLGSTAGDVRYLTNQPRVETHFHDIPPDSSRATIARLLDTYPELEDPETLSPSQAAFVSGYVLHLIWDVNWTLAVFCPHYLHSDRWSRWRDAMIHHNALRLVLDRRAFAALSTSNVAATLRRARPDQWVPFIADTVLRQWRDWIAHHLTTPQNVEGAAVVFAERMDISVDQLLNVARAIETDTDGAHVPGLSEALHSFKINARADSIEALRRYWHVPKTATTR